MKIKNIVTVLLVTIILASCAPAAKVVPTITAAPTSTFTPVPATSTITITPAPENTDQASSGSSYELGERLVYAQAGFSFQPIKDYDVIPIEMDKGAQNVILHDKAKNFSIYVYGTKTDNRFNSAADVLIFWMPAISKK